MCVEEGPNGLDSLTGCAAMFTGMSTMTTIARTTAAVRPGDDTLNLPRSHPIYAYSSTGGHEPSASDVDPAERGPARRRRAGSLMGAPPGPELPRGPAPGCDDPPGPRLEAPQPLLGPRGDLAPESDVVRPAHRPPPG